MDDMKKNVAKHIEFYPFKGVKKFYDIGKLLANPQAFKFITHLMTNLCKSCKPTHLGALDARGFLFGASVSYVSSVPLMMIRKLGKMPNVVTSGQYDTEYGHRDGLAVQRHVIGDGAKVVLIDDLVATGGSLAAAIETVEAAGGTVVGCVSIVELDAFAEQRSKVLSKDIPRFAVFTETELAEFGAKAASLPETYVDDGKTFETKGAMNKV